ncbi:MAG: S41 family peptidase [Epsilonproteobacteria bacterium]|nr:S41 family peptidase [Campylobacterota bacterium]
MQKNIKYVSLGFASTLLAASLIFSPSLFAKADIKKESAEKKLEALAKFTKVITLVEKYYVDELNISDIIDKAISGLLTNLDAHSSFLNKKSYKELQIQTEGEFGGLGITVGIRDGALTVIAPIEDTPAYKAGLKAGDIILKIGDKSTLNMTLDEAVSLMRGKPKTDIVLTIIRKGETKPLTVKITRDIIKVKSVYSKMVEGTKILYLRVTNFDKKVERDVRKAIKAHKNIEGIVLDLRNNPGGLLSQAVGLVDLFVDKGVIVSQKGRAEGENEVYNASEITTVYRGPLVVLVNEGSASASEIVSGSLQDHKRAVIVGQKTFGKGSVQVIMPLDKDEALRLTIAKYYLPSGRTIQAVGVTPDIEVYPGKVPHEEDKLAIKESELKKHLKNELEKIEGKKKKKKETKLEKDRKKKLITKEDILNDLQLKSAIDTIKVLEISKSENKSASKKSKKKN